MGLWPGVITLSKGHNPTVHGGVQALSLVSSYWTHKDKALSGHNVLLLPRLTLLVDAVSVQDLIN